MILGASISCDALSDLVLSPEKSKLLFLHSFKRAQEQARGFRRNAGVHIEVRDIASYARDGTIGNAVCNCRLLNKIHSLGISASVVASKVNSAVLLDCSPLRASAPRSAI